MKVYKTLLSLFLAVLILSSLVSVEGSANQVSGPSLQTTYSVNPSVLTPESDGYIQLSLKNSGDSTASNIKITVGDWTNEIKRSGSWVVNLGSLSAGGSVDIPFKFSIPKNTPSGYYTVDFYIDYSDNSTFSRVNQKAIITVQTPTALELTSVSPNSLNAGETTTLVFDFENNGKDKINDIKISWKVPNDMILPLGSDNHLLIPSIGAGEKIKVPVDIIVSSATTPGVYPLTIVMEYYDRAGIKQNISSQAGILVSSSTDFEVVLQDSTTTSTTLAISNIGVNTAYSTIVKIPEQENFRVTGSSAVTMGNLDAGDYTLATFQVVENEAIRSKMNDLVVEISYTSDLGD
ncbi:MAG: NEW3 domain-containing protein, partial [Halobacteriota archaeon]|nr:NEW3 domain-containing protein [Halobacteriota archaeon]